MDSRFLATIIIFPIWLTLVLVFRRHRQWLFYYLTAAFGLTLQLVFLAEYFGIDQLLVNIASFHVHLISKYLFHLPMELLTNGRFQIITAGNSSILKLGIECSAILESSILIALVLFYPLFNPGQKLLRITFGLIVTYVINIFRLMIIVLMAYKFGSDYIFVAHAGVARVFFFICELLLYWYLMTKPTVKSVGESILAHEPLEKVAKVSHALHLKHALGQLTTIILFVILATSSFVFSSEWQKAFVGIEKKPRPIIYQEETGLETDKEILGQDIKLDLLDQIEVNNFAPGNEWRYFQSFLEEGKINLQIEDQNSLEPLLVEIYLNDSFENRAIIKQEDLSSNRQIFQKSIPVERDDIVNIRIRNIGSFETSFIVKILKETTSEQ
ncbi:MAG: hypothetical protein AAB785_02055 [Patescibacteria group bacterium]